MIENILFSICSSRPHPNLRLGRRRLGRARHTSYTKSATFAMISDSLFHVRKPPGPPGAPPPGAPGNPAMLCQRHQLKFRDRALRTEATSGCSRESSYTQSARRPSTTAEVTHGNLQERRSALVRALAQERQGSQLLWISHEYIELKIEGVFTEAASGCARETRKSTARGTSARWLGCCLRQYCPSS